jgi:hypothetical protein
LVESLGLWTASAVGAFTLAMRVSEKVPPTFFMEDVIAFYSCNPLFPLELMLA